MENGIPKTLTEMFEHIGKSRCFDKNTTIYCQDEEADYFYYLKKGKVRIFMTSENGMEKTLSVIGKGEILGEAAFFDGQPRISSASALTNCELIAVNTEILTDIISKNPQTAFELLRLQAQTIRMLSSQLDSMTFVGAKGRIARFLMQSLPNPNSRNVSTTHEEIASVIGVSRVTVSKIMTQLVKDGVLKTGYKNIEILDKEQLEALCESRNF